MPSLRYMYRAHSISPIYRHLLLAIGLVLVVVTGWQITQQQPAPPFKLQPEIASSAPSSYTTTFATHGVVAMAHSAAAVELDNGDILAIWYGGTGEKKEDVCIYKNRWSASNKTWGRESKLIDVRQTRIGSGRFTRKLGNPVITRGPDDKLWLFYVSTVGGWATSKINLITSSDEGESWSPPRQLQTSPFFNLSTLVKGKPIHYEDGTVGLPVYHEFIGKFGELLRLNQEGEVVDKSRLAWGRDSLQPTIMPFDQRQAISMMRYAGDEPYRILVQYTDSAGVDWSTPEKSDLPNPNAAISGLSIKGGRELLLVFNNDPEERDQLSLARSKDRGVSWKVLHVFDQRSPEKGKKEGFSYPSLIQTKNGDFHLFYTWNQSDIKHVRFTPAWVESR
jgi:predicted neuraminidase